MWLTKAHTSQEAPNSINGSSSPKAIAFCTKTYKNFSELKIKFNEALDNNLPDILQDNVLVENYINDLAEKVDKELATSEKL